MKRTRNISSLLAILVLLSSCTSGRWVVKDEKAVDRTDFEVLEERQFLTISDTLTPEDPTFRLNVLARITRSYQQKTLVQRSIQDYRLRPGFVALGLAGAAAAFYAANSGRYNTGSGQSVTLNIVGALLAASGFINLKPSGEPRAVGEERYLHDSGKLVVTDTVDVRTDIPSPLDFTVTYRDQIIFEDSLGEVAGGSLQLPLAASFDDLNLTGEDPGTFDIAVSFNDSTYQHRYPVSAVLQPYAQITTEYAELRNAPVVDPENVLADLARGSKIEVESTDDEQWYKVRYGNFENFVSKDEAALVWESANVDQSEQLVTVPRIPFGNIDVESNIPVLRPTESNRQALIITNENYSQSLPERRHTHRDGKLMTEYLKKALGYPEQNIHQLTDVQSPEQVFEAIETIGASANDSTELFVFAGGFGQVEGEDLYLESVALEQEAPVNLPLRTLFSRIGSLTTGQTTVLADVDFSHDTSGVSSEQEGASLMESYAQLLTNTSDAVLVVGSRLGQPSRLYQSSRSREDKKHHIFPYLFVRALQQQRTDLEGIYDYLDRNLSYTSRRLHDRPQSLMIFGNRLQSFVESLEEE